MTIMDFLAIFSLIASIASVILAIVAITFSRSSEIHSRNNFTENQKMMADYYDKIKNVLAELDKRATITEKTVTDSHEKLLNTVTSLIQETIFPKKPDIGEQFGTMFLQLMIQNPEAAAKMLETMRPWIELTQKYKKENEEHTK